jgi:hypothetical protein
MIKQIGLIQEFVKSLEDKWIEIETREDLFQYNHYMRFFYLINVDEDAFKNQEKHKSVLCKNQEILNILEGILKDNNYKDLGKCYFIKLDPQKYPIRQYYESEGYTDCIRRFLVPVIVNLDSKLCIDSGVYVPEPGEVFDVDPESLYSVYNSGKESVVYLVVDLIKN